MRWGIRSFVFACGASLVAWSTAAAEPTLSLKEILSQKIGPINFERTDMGKVLERVAVEIHTPIEIDQESLERNGISGRTSMSISEPDQKVDKLLFAILKSYDLNHRLCFAATTDKFGRIELLLTVRSEAAAKGLLIVPESVAVSPPEARISVEFVKNTLENGLLLVCLQLGANLQLDALGLAKAGISPTRLFSVKIEGRTASSALGEILKQFDPTGSTTYLFVENPEKKLVLVVGTKERLEKLGSRAEPADFKDLAEKSPPGPQQLWMLRSPLRWVADSLAKPIKRQAREVSLAGALEIIAQETGLKIETSVLDLEIAGISRSQTVNLDPRDREARAVLYDVLWQADPQKEGSLVACVELRKDDSFAVLVTTRLAANSAGRSLLNDYNLSPDDIKSGKD